MDLGYPATADLNGTEQEGAAFQDMTVVESRRLSVADAYLRPLLSRPNLTVATSALARRLIVSQGRCTGVEYATEAGIVRADAAAEVILTAGAIGSAHLLMVSGIGPAKQEALSELTSGKADSFTVRFRLDPSAAEPDMQLPA